jgi:hypothetical protein
VTGGDQVTGDILVLEVHAVVIAQYFDFVDE